MLQALADAQLSAGDLAAVELVGSSSRVPALLAILTEVLGQEPGRTQNAKEAVSKGCALCCAMLSPIFKCAPARVQQWDVNARLRRGSKLAVRRGSGGMFGGAGQRTPCCPVLRQAVPRLQVSVGFQRGVCPVMFSCGFRPCTSCAGAARLGGLVEAPKQQCAMQLPSRNELPWTDVLCPVLSSRGNEQPGVSRQPGRDW